ncbi:MAG: NADPH:quinone oxidoreductase family protein [Saprospiraceae bacterium]|nr:NADPH:quinone oxidoreductase family protein [Saprospiraceae bacterium]
MKAIVCTQYGPPNLLEYKEIAAPECRDNEIIVNVKYCSVNFPDTLIIQGKYQFRPEPPFVPGSDFSGIISRVGNKVSEYKIGDEVIGMAKYGGFAKEIAVAPALLTRKPKEMSFKEASCFLYTYSTAYYALKHRAHIKSGHKVVILGASGGVGLAAVELAKYFDAIVIAAASTEEKLEICKQYGADHIINYSKEDLKIRIKELTNGQGADIILDPIGASYSEAALRAIAWEGHYLVVGFAAGEIPRVPLNLVLLKGCQITGVFLGSFAMRFPGKLETMRNELLSMYSSGNLKPHIQKVMPLDKTPEAIQMMVDRKAIGKLVIKI